MLQACITKAFMSLTKDERKLKQTVYIQHCCPNKDEPCRRLVLICSSVCKAATKAAFQAASKAALSQLCTSAKDLQHRIACMLQESCNVQW